MLQMAGQILTRKYEVLDTLIVFLHPSWNYILHEFSGELCAVHDQFNLGHFLVTYQELLFVSEYKKPVRLHFAALFHCALNPHVPVRYSVLSICTIRL